MREILFNFLGINKARQPATPPTKEVGTSGTAIYGGFIQNDERHPSLSNQRERYKTAADMLANVSIIAAGVRYFLNLTAKPKWSVDPADDTPEAQKYAEWVEMVMDCVDSPWSRVVRRSSTFRYHGFSIQAWTAKRMRDGTIGYLDIETRPQFTIERWETDDVGAVTGVWQRSPQDGQELWMPRNRIIYVVDDMLTDSPEGMGWFRHLVEPAERLRAYLALEAMGFERDLSGIPVGRAPISDLNRMVKEGKLTQQQADAMLKGLRDFVTAEVKKKNTGMIMDSAHFTDTSADGPKTTGVSKWAIELLTSSSSSLPQLTAAIDRLKTEMALVMGVENILTGTGGDGSLALSRDKSNNLYLQVNSTLQDMASQFTKDFIDPLWKMNGFPEEMKPKLKTEDVSFKDVEQVTAALASMAQAGAVLAPNDPAINDVRDLLGLSRIEEGMMDFGPAFTPPAEEEVKPQDNEEPEAADLTGEDGNA